MKNVNGKVSQLKNYVAATPLRILGLINIIVCFVLLAAAITAGLMPAAVKFQLYGAPIPFFIASTAVCGALFLITDLKVNEKIRRLYPLLVVIFFVVNIAVLTAVAFGLVSSGYTWDSQLVFDQAVNYATKGSIDDSFISYVVISPNNIGLLAILGGLFKTVHSFGITHYMTVAIALNVAVLSLSQLLTFLVTKMLYGRRIATIALLFCFIFISLSMYVQIPYTDTLTIIFPILLMYLSLNFVRSRYIWMRLIIAFSIGCVTILGYYMKPTVVIASGVIILVALLALLTKRYVVGLSGAKLKNTLVAVGCLILVIVGAAGGYIGFSRYVDNLAIIPYPFKSANENSYPVYHFLNIGMKYRVYDGIPYYGGFNEQTADTVRSLPTEQDKIDYSINQIKEQLSGFGPLGYSKFLILKGHWILSDATFFAYGEGSNESVRFAHNDIFSQGVRSFMYVGGERYVLFANILQIFWIALLVLIGVQLVVLLYNKPSRENLFMTIPRLMIAGIIIFLLFFEGRSRYIYLYVPIFIVCAMYILSWYKNLNKSAVEDSAKVAAKQ